MPTGGYGSGGNGQQQAENNPLELQQRILSILSSSSGGQSSVPAPTPVPAPVAPWAGADNSSGQQQSDPANVQKALDSLIQTGPNILKHYQQQPSNNQQQHGRPGMMQQPGNYYQMGKRF